MFINYTIYYVVLI